MRGISLKKILELAKNDAERIKSEAKIVVQIDENGKIIDLQENPNGKISVLAVIGTVGVIDERVEKILWKKGILDEFLKEQVILLEIGMIRGKPYRTGYDKEKKNGTYYIPPRRKWFFLSHTQYLNLSPALFLLLKSEARDRRQKWLKHETSFLLLRKESGFRKERTVADLLASCAGVRFSVSLKDTFICSDILWAEKENEVRKRFLNYFCRLSIKLLSSENKKQKNKDNLKKYLMRPHRRRSFYVIEDMIELLPMNKKFIAADIANLIGWDFQETKERRLRNAVLPNPLSRVDDIELRIERIDNSHKYLVFEVFSIAIINKDSDCLF